MINGCFTCYIKIWIIKYMLNFKIIDKNQIEEYKKYYDYSTSFGCDTNLINIYLWRHEYNINLALFDDTLIKAYFRDDGMVWGYCMPVGKNIEGALEEIFNDARERSAEPNIVMLTIEQKALLESLYPNKFIFKPSLENQDYIYYSKDLATLEGRKFHSKRNHISRFYRTYKNTKFKMIDKTNKSDAMGVVFDWYKENNISSDDSSEIQAVREALENMEKLKMNGALLYVDERPVAMTLGSEISDRVYDINFEKALRDYDGVYSVINNEFAKTLTQYEYINREEDMGIEGLRKAKLSYNPVIVLQRFTAEVKL